MLDWEFGDMVAWVSLNGDKPIAVNIYRKDGHWTWQCHGYELTDKQRIEVEGFFKERVSDLNELWKQNMKTRLPWDNYVVGRKRKK